MLPERKRDSHGRGWESLSFFLQHFIRFSLYMLAGTYRGRRWAPLLWGPQELNITFKFSEHMGLNGLYIHYIYLSLNQTFTIDEHLFSSPITLNHSCRNSHYKQQYSHLETSSKCQWECLIWFGHGFGLEEHPWCLKYSLFRQLTSVWIRCSRCCVVCVEWAAWCLWFVWGMISAALNNDHFVRPDGFTRASRYDLLLTGLMNCDCDYSVCF